MLTPYDEFPVHQAPHTFSHIPSTDYAWDDGYWFGVFNADEKLFLGTYMRVNPNTDMIGGCALLNVAGYQITVRFNRCWRRNFALEIGPYRMTIEEPLKRIRLEMADHGSGLSFDLVWEGTSPAFLEEHHTATYRGRRTTDQTRYSQPGKCRGWIKFRDRSWQVEPDNWSGSRDHSWGLYASRPPLSPSPALLPPPANDDGPKRALRFWTCFRTEPFSGFYHVHETAQGVQCKMNDVFGTPFDGRIFRGWGEEDIELASGRHEMDFIPGTRILKQARFFLTDTQGREWRQIFDIETPPWIVQPMGAFPGSWKDGGTFFTYHGSEELALEWDEGDYSVQPFEYTPYAVSGAAAAEGFNTGTSIGNMVHGPEYLARVTTHAPDGSISTGAAQVELFINGPYAPYGFA
ncbi:hypothetical protein [Sphingobium yanoikuyae]|uniref:hypothetical protein n=1 Tax=Sphingobium yanoikuyae TaxID=13690 RepID=UPI0026E9B63A|nr:hypothetical protein [Sphingobium yanoikuyae]